MPNNLSRDSKDHSEKEDGDDWITRCEHSDESADDVRYGKEASIDETQVNQGVGQGDPTYPGALAQEGIHDQAKQGQ